VYRQSLRVCGGARNVRTMPDGLDPTALTVIATRTVTDKTARDGRLEIGERAARQLMDAGVVSAELDGAVAPARVDRFDCDCRDDFRHFYVESDALKRVPIGRDVTISLDTGNQRILIQRVGR
jgi:hypothetical protein